ncbi:hypothetical protein [Aquimarina celericrescens]|uniref:HTH cro/C1-type domain-containing protein n=1 Tax=Aquimarina celericrescens TaxID=1964542 RepID=A0ABW5B1F6_9FLAO|nr:hypothetical protein [Aquimarina celericrescens]
MSSIKKRILRFIAERNISKYKFYQETGITRGVLDSDSGITEDNIMKFIETYPEVDLNWLIKGEEKISNILVKNKEETIQNLERKDFIKDEIIRLLTVDKEIQDAFKYIIGKEINTFTSKKLLNLISEKSFIEAMFAYVQKNKSED